MNRRTWERLAWILLLVAAPGCGNEGTPQTPGGDGTPVVILDASTAAGWTGTVLDSRRDIQCRTHTDTLTAPQSYWRPGDFVGGVRVEGVPGNPQCCNSAHQLSTIRSVPRFDLSQYVAARVQCRIRPTLYLPSSNEHQVTFTIRSNVPGSQDLQAFRVAPDVEQTIDVSLENALSYHEASFELAIQTGGSCFGPPDIWSGDIIVEVLQFKIVGTRR